MNRLFDEALRGTGLPAGGPSQGGNFVNASMNVSETDKEIRITAELPGVTEQDIDVSLDDDVLTIRGEKKFERTDDKENFHFVERSYGTFQRSVRLPYAVDPEQVQAHCENGVLTVTLPKTAQQEPPAASRCKAAVQAVRVLRVAKAAQVAPEVKADRAARQATHRVVPAHEASGSCMKLDHA
jgi:HSP20 family molecular chaperone IbpA